MKRWKKGDIILWYGAVADIRKGWALCDGNNGTPDLAGLFVRGAGFGFIPNSTGGESQHNHNLTMNSHYHQNNPNEPRSVAGGETYRTYTSPATSTGTVGVKLHIPPYHVLCYIMKL